MFTGTGHLATVQIILKFFQDTSDMLVYVDNSSFLAQRYRKQDGLVQYPSPALDFMPLW